MAAGKTEGEALLEVVDELCAELGHAQSAAAAPGAESGIGALDRELIWGSLSPEEESLVLKIRAGLASLAAAVGSGSPEGIAHRAVRVALDGAEVMIRGELLNGNLARLPELVPSFVYLVTAPVAHQDQALSLSQRTSELVQETLGR